MHFWKWGIIADNLLRFDAPQHFVIPRNESRLLTLAAIVEEEVNHAIQMVLLLQRCFVESNEKKSCALT